MVASTTANQLRQCLSDVDFPANRQDLLTAADRHGCDDETIRALRAMPSETYTNVAQVIASVTIADGQNIQDGDAAAARRSHPEPDRPETATQSAVDEALDENRDS